MRVTIDGRAVPLPMWPGTRPRPGTHLLIQPVPAGDAMRNVLTIAVTVGAIALGQFYGPLLAGSLLGLPGAASGSLASLLSAGITGTTLLAGTLLINALVPPRSDTKEKPTYAIQGLQNQLTPDAPVPLILGRVRFAPPYAATPYTQAVGDERYVTAAFLVGYGPLVMRNWRIGETPIERFTDVILETRQGYTSDERLTLYTQQVIEEALSVALKTSQVPTGGPQIRTTASDCTGCEIDVTSTGIYQVNKDGAYQNFTVNIGVRYCKSGTNNWQPGPAISITSNKAKALTRTVPITFPERGRYDIELTRSTTDWDEVDQSNKTIQRHGATVWSVLRSLRPEYPIDFPEPLALAACRIRATGQLNGMLDALNCDVATLCPDWDEASGTWIVRETNNPASLFRYVLTGPAMAYPLTLAEVGALEDWHRFCAAKGLTYNRVHDFDATVLEVLGDVAAAGRASPHDTGEVWQVVIDRALTVVSAHISPRNSWSYQGKRPYTVFPDAFRISFLDETNGFAKAERLVPWPGHSGDIRVTEKLDMPGVTNPDMVWREARKRQYELIHRPDTHTVNQDFEALTVSRGDRAQFSHDVLDRTMVAARVTNVLTVAGTTMVYLDEFVSMEAGQSYAIRFRRADGASLLRTVATVPGEASWVRLTGAGDIPAGPTADDASGELAFFGPSSRESFAVTVKGFEAMEDFAARLTLIDHAPEIEALVDAEVPPPWSGRAGGPAQEQTGTPLAPIINNVVSGVLASDAATPTNPVPVVVLLRADPLETLTIASFEVRHREIGAATWMSAPGSAAAGAVVLPGYEKGDGIELQARAISVLGTPGSWTASLTHQVAATDPAPLPAPYNLSATSPSAGQIRVQVTAGPAPETVATQIYIGPAGAPFAAASKVGDPIVSGPNTTLPPLFFSTLGNGNPLASGTTYRVWATALDTLDGPSTPSLAAGPADVTVA
ncbi:phage tail protein [Methylobacterium sp. 17Sr1-1]|uniref:TipJ family phage tail tip protein n=1 Tax=Methylobacterium sp. 17Sr1-1 TaxID=2202826 RepID=UPI000D700458|nr:phage tail protein [Methylobacterium sp. 17Sr1-1]AWN55069.1 phage tail protein [Methylobacterium sp. 17Sr1-1]